MPSDKAHRDADYERARKIIREAKDVPCADCKIKYPWYVMDFDHVRGIKRFNIGSTRGAGRKTLLLEIGKCDVVCSNCHRERTFQRSVTPP